MISLCIVKSQTIEPINEQRIRPKLFNVLPMCKGCNLISIAQGGRVKLDNSKSLMLDEMSIRMKSTYLFVTTEV